MSAEDIQALTDAVAAWRMQEVRISFLHGWRRRLMIGNHSIFPVSTTAGNYMYLKANQDEVAFYCFYVSYFVFFL
jgi:hypothetical protein